MSEQVDYEKILRAYMTEVTECEGSDYLGRKGAECSLPGLSDSENKLLTRIRDETRAENGWPDYTAIRQQEKP